MPIAPHPTTFRCPACGWQKTVIPRSDVLIRNHNWFDECPECHHSPLERAQAGPLAQWAARLKETLGK